MSGFAMASQRPPELAPLGRRLSPEIAPAMDANSSGAADPGNS
jgi:hypothetical protein